MIWYFLINQGQIWEAKNPPLGFAEVPGTSHSQTTFVPGASLRPGPWRTKHSKLQWIQYNHADLHPQKTQTFLPLFAVPSVCFLFTQQLCCWMIMRWEVIQSQSTISRVISMSIWPSLPSFFRYYTAPTTHRHWNTAESTSAVAQL